MQAVGHADFVEDVNGNWWAVCHGIRKLSYGLLHNLGRETLLVPVIWTEDGWPIAGNIGKVPMEMEAPLPKPPYNENTVFFDDFSNEKRKLPWTFIRDPAPGTWSLSENPGCLTLTGDVSLSDPFRSPAFIGVRQQEHNTRVETILCGNLAENQCAGLAAYYNANYHYEIYLRRTGKEYYLCVNRRIHDLEAEVFTHAIDYTGSVKLVLSADERFYHFFYTSNDGLLVEVC